MEQKGSVVMQSSSATIAKACLDITELYNIYRENWFDLEGNIQQIDSVTLQVVQNDLDNSEIFLFIQMEDYTEGALFQSIAKEATDLEVKAICSFAKSAINCDVSVISVL